MKTAHAVLLAACVVSALSAAPGAAHETLPVLVDATDYTADVCSLLRDPSPNSMRWRMLSQVLACLWSGPKHWLRRSLPAWVCIGFPA